MHTIAPVRPCKKKDLPVGIDLLISVKNTMITERGHLSFLWRCSSFIQSPTVTEASPDDIDTRPLTKKKGNHRNDRTEGHGV